MNSSLSAVLEKKDQQRKKKKVIKKHQREHLQLKIFILGKIARKNQLHY